MKKLAIRGHSTRGKEVIELLEMMGGCSPIETYGLYENRCYLIKDNGWIGWDYIGPEEIDKYNIFTLEEFLEKYPFKNGDFVRIPEYESEVRICKMKWCKFGYVEYLLYRNDDEEWYTANELLEYNDNPNKTRDCKKCGLHFGSVRCFAMDCPHNTPKSYAVGLKDGKVIECAIDKEIDMKDNKVESTGFMQMGKTVAVIFNDANYEDEVELQLGDYEIEVRDGKTYAVLKKPKYPKTYVECCEVIANSKPYAMNEHYTDVNKLLQTFQTLYICRNAYWKILGEEMGLGKPWEPEYSSLEDNTYFIIQTFNGEIDKSATSHRNAILAFPTIEMRDAFYENFKDLIEECKELL